MTQTLLQCLKDLPQIAKPLGRLALIVNNSEPIKLGFTSAEEMGMECTKKRAEIASKSVAFSECLTFTEVKATLPIAAEIVQAD